MKKATAVALCALAALCASGAMKWKNFDDKSHLSGPKLTEDDLLGKAVLLYYWDAADEASVKYLPEVEKVWDSFKTKKFAVIGTYGGAKDEAKIKAAVEKGKVTFPVYYKFDMDPPPTHSKTPYFCVINHRGSVVYSGAGMKDATQKSVEAMTAIGMPVSLCGDVEFKKFKGLAGQLKLGKNVTNIMKTLEKKKGDKDPNVSSEASEILSAIESARDDVKSDIELYSQADPAEALKLVQLFMKTWPKDDASREFKSQIPELKAKAKEKAKADKEKAKEKAK